MNKTKTFMLIFAVLFISFVAYQRFSLPLDSAMFTPDALYRGTNEGMTIDPKDYYMKLNGLTFTGGGDDFCHPSVLSENSAIPIKDVSGNYLPLVYKGTETDYVKLIGKDGEGLFAEKQNIVMPVSNSKFKNSNLQDSTIFNRTNGQNDIEIIKGDKIIIILEDVMTWWCHAHNPRANIQHDVRVGYNSNIESIRGGSIVGVAKSTTKIKVYQVKTANLKAEDVKSSSDLQQIDAGEYLVKGEIKAI